MESRTILAAIRKSLVAIAITVITVPAFANTGIDPVEKVADVKYLGAENQSLVFNVKYDNAKGSRFIVTIKNEDGVTIFQNAFTDAKFDKKFVLPKTEAGKVVFIISDRKNSYSESFEISTRTRVIEDVVVDVKKLD
ncbi:MAG: hypothetical protein ACTHMM_14715 [Agriterribacter sp.]